MDDEGVGKPSETDCAVAFEWEIYVIGLRVLRIRFAAVTV